MCLKLFQRSKEFDWNKLLAIPSGAPKKGDFPVLTITFSELKAELAKQGIEHIRKDAYAPDQSYHFTTLEWWEKLAPWLVIPASFYIDDIFNCKNYAELARLKSAHYFGLDGAISNWGNTPDGFHAWVCPFAGVGRQLRALEVNAGFACAGVLHKPGEINYYPKGWE